MIIEQSPSTDGEASWEAIKKWIGERVRTPEGTPVSENLAGVLAVGALIGARFALISTPFALGLAHYCNTQPGPVFESIQQGFAEDYAKYIAEQIQILCFNNGFTHTVHSIGFVAESESAPGITEEDAKSIMDGLDGLFGSSGKETA